MKKMAMLLLCCVCAGAECALGAATRFGPDITLYASFDSRPDEVLDSDASFPRPARGLSYVLWSGATGIYPAVDFSLNGMPLIHQCGLVPAVDGRRGQAVRLGKPGEWRKSALAFDAIGNVFPDQGTIGFWVRFMNHCPPDNGSGFLLNVVSMTAPSYLAVYIERGHRLKAYVDDGFGQRHALQRSVAGLGLHQGQWTHFALAWDHRFGIVLYVDGKECLSNWGRRPWQTRDHIEGVSLGHMRWTTMPGQLGGYASFDRGTVIDYDEFVAFKRALSAAEVAEIHASNRLSPRPAHTDTAAENATRQHRCDMLGWKEQDGLPEIPLAGAGAARPALVRQAEIRNAYTVKFGTHAVLDGRWRTSWSPGTDHRYSVGNDQHRFALPPGEVYNFVRAVASVLPATGTTTDDKGRTLSPFVLPVGTTRFQRLPLPTPQAHTELVLTATTGLLHDLALFHVDPDPPKLEPAPADAVRLQPISCRPDSLCRPPPGRRLPRFSAASAFAEDQDRSVVLLGREPPTAPVTVPVRAGRFLHVDVPEPDAATALDSIELDLWFADLTAPTRFWIGIPEPVLRERYLFEFDWKALPRPEAGAGRLWVRCELPGIVVQPGQNLRFSVMTDRDLTLNDGPGQRSSIRVWARDPGRAAEAYYNHQLHVIKDTFGAASEPRQWILGGAPYNVVRAVGSMIEHLETLARIRADWRAAGLYSLITTNMRAPWDGGPRQEPFVPTELFRAAASWPEPTDEHPAWAFWWRETYRRMRGVVDWWIDNRQIHTGEFGGPYSDDTDMVHEWANLAMIWDEDGKLADSFCRLSDFCWHEKNIDGLSLYRNDSDLHCYEEGMNIHGGTLLFRYGDPVCYNRVLTMAQHTDGNLTGLNAKGQRLFRNQTYTAHGSRRGQPQDDGIFFRMEPTLWLTWYNAHPEAVRLLREWMDTRLARFPAANPASWPGVIRFEDGKDLPASRNIYLSYDALFLLTRLTGDQRYLAPVLHNMACLARGDPLPSLETGIQDFGMRMAGWGEALWWRFALFNATRQTPWWSAFKTHLTHPWRLARQSAEARAATVVMLQDAVKLLDERRSVLTWMGQSPDRVFMSGWPGQFFAMTLGGPARSRNTAPIPQHAVSYEGADGDVARWVLHSRFDALGVALYSFHAEPKTVVLRPWLLTPGEYEIRTGADTDDALRIGRPVGRRTVVLRRYDNPIRIALPPKTVYVVEAELRRALPAGFDLPDAAISIADVEFIPAIPALRIPVHNIGRAPLEHLPVHVVDVDSGRVLWKTTVPHLAAPRDLAPKTVLTFTGRLDLADTRRLGVWLDPEETVNEFTRANNQVALTVPSAPRQERSPAGEPIPIPPFRLDAEHAPRTWFPESR